MPTRNPRCRRTVEGFAHVRYGQLGGKRVPGQAHCPHRHPAHPASSFIPIPACARLRLRECCTCGHGLSIDGVCGAASSSLHWYRVSSFLLNPDPGVPQARCSSSGCPATPMARPGTLDAYARLVLHRHSLRSPLFSRCSGVSALFALATLLPHFAVLRSRLSPPNDSAMSHNPASKRVQGPIVSEEFQPQASEISKKEVGQSAPPKPALRPGSSSHIGDCTAQWQGAPCIFRKNEKSISRTFRRASGGSPDGNKGEFSPLNPCGCRKGGHF